MNRCATFPDRAVRWAHISAIDEPSSGAMTMWHFFASHLWTILGLVASFGTIGVGVAVLAFGVPAALIVARLVAVAREALRFLATPTGQAAAVVGLCLASFVAGDIRRTRLDDAAWRAREEQAAR